jgi:hypothetical protein
MCLSLEGMMVH